MSKERRLIIVLLLNVVMIAALVIVGIASHSLGVLAAGGDYAADAAAIVISLLAIRMSLHPHGHPKATTYAALINTVFMLSVTTVVIIEGLRRLLTHTSPIEALPVIIVSIIAVSYTHLTLPTT